jgi:hypothetical protein
MPTWRNSEQRLHAERAGFVGHDRHDDLADFGIAQQLRQEPHEHHRGGCRAPFGALRELFEQLGIGRRRQRSRVVVSDGQRAAKCFAALLQIGDFRALLVGTVVRRVADFLFGNRDAETLADGTELVFAQLLLLMRDVLAFGRVAEAISLDRAHQEDGGLAFVLDRRLVSVVNLHRIVPAQLELLEIVV